MKIISSIFLMLLCLCSYAKDDVYTNLVGVNKCWTEQKDLPVLTSLSTDKYHDRDWIKLHLSLVEQTLRNRSTVHLSLSQKANRLTALDRLHEYRLQGNFPVNDKYTYRTPIFIDDRDNFCAVGYLVKATGHEHVSRMIAANTNLAYVREMNYPELNKWANDYGFTTDELAWIQPSYGPVGGCGTEEIGKGTNGDIYELYVNNTGDKLYVGGSFTEADSSVSVNNFAYVTEAGGTYTWHDLGGGVNGTVYTIQEFQGKLFVGGSFSMAGSTPVNNVAYWDGTSWHEAGCIYGTVKDLIVYNNELYAAGDFDVCAAMSDVNIAKWNGTMWGNMPFVNGHVNTLEEYNGALLLGGSFSILTDTMNIIKWTEANGYETFSNNIKNEVMDIGIFNNTVHAVCKRTAPDDSNLIQVLSGNTWSEFSGTIDNHIANNLLTGFYTFCAQNDTVLIGGDFEAFGMMYDPMVRHVLNLYDVPTTWGNSGNWFMVDDAVHKMVVFKNEVVFAGKFKNGMNNFLLTELNHIGKKKTYPLTNVNEVTQAKPLKAYPNPVSANSIIKVENNIQATQGIIKNINGATVFETHHARAIDEIQLPLLASGTYFLELRNSKGEKAVERIVIK